MDLEEWIPGRLASMLPRRRHLKLAVAREKGKNRSGTFTVLTFGAAAVAFMLALFGVGPFAVQALVVTFAAGDGPIPASAVFPAVQPTHKTVIVYDPPKSAPASPRPAPSPRPSAKPSPTEGDD